MNFVDSQGGKRKRSLSDDAPPPPPSNAPVAPSKRLLSRLLSFLMQCASYAQISTGFQDVLHYVRHISTFKPICYDLMRSADRSIMAIVLTSVRQCHTNQLLHKGPE